MKKLKYILQLFDGLWSFPVAILGFYLVGVALQAFGGLGVGTYDIGFIQPLLLAVAVVIGATNAAVLGLFFTFRGFFRYLYGQKKEDGSRINYSKIDWKKLSPCARYLFALFLFCFFVVSVLSVYLKLV
jgi:hypothetical protein